MPAACNQRWTNRDEMPAELGLLPRKSYVASFTPQNWAGVPVMGKGWSFSSKFTRCMETREMKSQSSLFLSEKLSQEMKKNEQLETGNFSLSLTAFFFSFLELFSLPMKTVPPSPRGFIDTHLQEWTCSWNPKGNSLRGKMWVEESSSRDGQPPPPIPLLLEMASCM